MKKLLVAIAIICVAANVSAYVQADLDKLLRTKECPGCDLAEANLAGKDLRNAKLPGINLTKANLSRADLSGAVFYVEEYAGKPRANLSGANLSNAKLIKTNLIGANLTIFGISRQDLAANIIPAKISEMPHIIRTNLQQADLTGANLAGADLLGADLTQTNFTDADLTDADFSSARFASTNLTNAITSGWRASKVIFDMQSKTPVIIGPKDALYIETYRKDLGQPYVEESQNISLILCGCKFNENLGFSFNGNITKQYQDMITIIQMAPDKSPRGVCKMFRAEGF